MLSIRASDEAARAVLPRSEKARAQINAARSEEQAHKQTGAAENGDHILRESDSASEIRENTSHIASPNRTARLQNLAGESTLKSEAYRSLLTRALRARSSLLFLDHRGCLIWSRRSHKEAQPAAVVDASPTAGAVSSVKNYAVGLEIQCPGGAYWWAPKIPTDKRLAGVVPSTCELVHNRAHSFQNGAGLRSPCSCEPHKQRGRHGHGGLKS